MGGDTLKIVVRVSDDTPGWKDDYDYIFDDPVKAQEFMDKKNKQFHLWARIVEVVD